MNRYKVECIDNGSTLASGARYTWGVWDRSEKRFVADRDTREAARGEARRLERDERGDVHAALRSAVEACERLVAVAAAAGDERLAMMARPAASVLRRQLTEREEKSK